MLLVLACKSQVLFTLFLFVYLFVSDFGFSSGQRYARGDHLRTLDFEAIKRSVEKKIRRQKRFLILIINKHRLVWRHVYSVTILYGIFFCPKLS